jgi:hypothetical protein
MTAPMTPAAAGVCGRGGRQEVSSLSAPPLEPACRDRLTLTTEVPAVLPEASEVGAVVGSGEVEGGEEGECVGKGEGESEGDCTVIDPCARHHDACAIGWRP